MMYAREHIENTKDAALTLSYKQAARLLEKHDALIREYMADNGSDFHIVKLLNWLGY